MLRKQFWLFKTCKETLFFFQAINKYQDHDATNETKWGTSNLQFTSRHFNFPSVFDWVIMRTNRQYFTRMYTLMIEGLLFVLPLYYKVLTWYNASEKLMLIVVSTPITDILIFFILGKLFNVRLRMKYREEIIKIRNLIMNLLYIINHNYIKWIK